MSQVPPPAAPHAQRRRIVVAAVALPLLLAPAALKCSPAVWEVPAGDSGVYLYVAQQMLEGRVPYRDVWDHKPPLVYWADALGLWLGHGSRWGVWVVEVATLALAAVVAFWLLAEAFGDGAAVWASAVWLLALPRLMQSGNFTEEFALPLQFLALLALAAAAQGRLQIPLAGVIVGLTGAGAVLARPNLVGTHLCVVGYLLIVAAQRRRWRDLAVWLVTMVGSGAIVLALVVGWFAMQGALAPFLDCVLKYNFAYAGKVSVPYAVVGSIRELPWHLTALAALGWCAGAWRLKRGRSEPWAAALLGVALLDLPFEMWLCNASGRAFWHYYLAMLPALAVVAGAFARALPLPLYGQAALLLLLLAPSARDVRSLLRYNLQVGDPRPWMPLVAPAVERVEALTSPDDEVLVWGGALPVNFVAHRRAPTRFLYQLPLLTKGYATPELIHGFVTDLARKPPKLILDASSTARFFPPLDAAAGPLWRPTDPLAAYDVPPAMDELWSFVAANYRAAETIRHGDDTWVVYERTEGTGR